MKKYLVCLMSLLLLLGLSAPASAGWEADPPNDTANNSTVGDYDILNGKVELYPNDAVCSGGANDGDPCTTDGDCASPGTCDQGDYEEYINICIEMGVSMPALLMLMINSDDDTATGYGELSMANLMTTCASGLPAPGGKIKPDAAVGIDVNIMIFLRDQLDTAASAYGDGCKGPPPGGSCMTRKDPCVGCDEGNVCYTGDTRCAPGDEGCWVRGDLCSVGTSNCTLGVDLCSDMSVFCDECVSPCTVGKVKGEWVANPFGGGGGQNKDPIERGRIDMPLPPGPGEGNEYCFNLPWKRIITAVAAASTADPAPDYTKAVDPANVKWELSTWYNPNEADDIITSAPPAPYTCVNVTDVVPNDNNLPSADANGGCCNGDFEIDTDVDGTDAFKFKADFGRRNCQGQCRP